MNLSEKILYCRKKAGLSQEALAEIVKDMKKRLLEAGSPDFEWGY